MAKKRKGKSRSQHIREYLKANPQATPSQIVEGLAAKGVKVSTGLASNVKYMSSPKAKRKKKRAVGRKKGRKRMVRRRRPSTRSLDVATLRAAAKFVSEVGDADAAIAAIKQVQTLQID